MTWASTLGTLVFAWSICSDGPAVRLAGAAHPQRRLQRRGDLGTAARGRASSAAWAPPRTPSRCAEGWTRHALQARRSHLVKAHAKVRRRDEKKRHRTCPASSRRVLTPVKTVHEPWTQGAPQAQSSFRNSSASMPLIARMFREVPLAMSRPTWTGTTTVSVIGMAHHAMTSADLHDCEPARSNALTTFIRNGGEGPGMRRRRGSSSAHPEGRPRRAT